MTTTMELSTSESEGVNDTVRGFEFINLNKCLNKSFNEYLLYITEHELKLTRKEKNNLGIHFIIKELIRERFYSNSLHSKAGPFLDTCAKSCSPNSFFILVRN